MELNTAEDKELAVASITQRHAVAPECCQSAAKPNKVAASADLLRSSSSDWHFSLKRASTCANTAVSAGNKWDKQRVISERQRVTGANAKIKRAANPVYPEKSLLLCSKKPSKLSRQRLENTDVRRFYFNL